MHRAKGRKNLTNRRGFVALAIAAMGVPLPSVGAGSANKAPNPSPPKAPVQRARLPRRLAADFHNHIETRLPHLREPFEAAAQDTGVSWRMLASQPCPCWWRSVDQRSPDSVSKTWTCSGSVVT